MVSRSIIYQIWVSILQQILITELIMDQPLKMLFLTMQNQGYDISIGRIGKLECDFIMRDNMNNYGYVQVTMTTMLNRETEDREYAPLEMIKDNYPKYVLTRNDMIQKRNGIIHENIPQFMVAGKLF